ncbi:histidine phosphatase family protein [Algibacter marinivivus]|uniref:Histidine phosphatase family protein n=1 Tax=Algibacter marinivivus TaxID=2100723 RepID=A0A2U2X509_9FLAO|nr:histidine phosphatase family protein [Algibacter marinivivus]PWH82868.1 histidine phosphatase family protein [Algibacter marinivivus]
MKKIILVRHAKSSWKFNVIDHQRPLKTRGYNDAEIISKSLKGEAIIVDKLVSSDAVRAKTTAEIFINNLNIDESIIEFNNDLYDFSGEKLIKVIKNIDDTTNNLMIFGHNHAITAFVNTFGTKYIDNVPTSGVVIIEFDIVNWSDLKQGITVKTLFPRDFKP